MKFLGYFSILMRA